MQPSEHADRARALSPAWAVAAAFGLATTALALSGRFASDEGQITFLGANLAAESPAAALFFQKLHPTLSLLYLPTSPVGWEAFLVAHCLVAALGVLAAWRWLDAEGLTGWVGGCALALSPAYAYSSLTGQSNSDGVALLFVALWASRARGVGLRVAAGALFGLLPWARYEFAPFVLLAVVMAARRGDRALAAGAVAAASTYLLAGSVYHQSGLWLFRSPPIEARLAPLVSEMFTPRLGARTLPRVLGAYGLTSGLWPLLLSPLAWARGGTARGLVGVSLALLLGFTVSPFFGLSGPEIVPRYLSVALPGSRGRRGLSPRRRRGGPCR
ncbi:MAG: hypothetical protein R3A52_20700 [Polyangiales bacterium]